MSQTPNYQQLHQLVHEMRMCQRKFFTTRLQAWLMEAKRVERDVDAWLKRYPLPPPPPVPAPESEPDTTEVTP
jgi:hypothetical protein